MSEVCVVPDQAALSRAAAELFVEACAGAAAARGCALVALTGGSSAQPVHAALREEPFSSRVPWAALQLFTGDERAVPESDPRSNFGLARRELFSKVPVREEQLHRFRGEAPDLAAEARRAAAELRAVWSSPAPGALIVPPPGAPPRFDLILLGLGPDGHVLSLFAGSPGSADRGDQELVRSVSAPSALEPRLPRLTLTPFLLVTARVVVLVTAGAAKASVLAKMLTGTEDLIDCPAQWLRRASGRVVIVADEAAASQLHSF